MNMTKVLFEKIKTTPELSNGSRNKTTLFFSAQSVTKINFLICIIKWYMIYIVCSLFLCSFLTYTAHITFLLVP